MLSHQGRVIEWVSVGTSLHLPCGHVAGHIPPSLILTCYLRLASVDVLSPLDYVLHASHGKILRRALNYCFICIRVLCVADRFTRLVDPRELFSMGIPSLVACLR